MNAMQIICLIFVVLISICIGRASKRPKFPIVGEIDFSIPRQKFYVDSVTDLEKIAEKNNYVVLKVIKSRQNQQP